MKKQIAFFGGTSGLGTQVIEYLKDYDVDSVGSAKVNLLNEVEIDGYFKNNTPDIVIIFSNYNYNSFLHKYSEFEELDKQIDINIKGVTKVISKSLSHMRTNKYGRIILASSITSDRSVIGTSLYASSKSYYESIVKNICIENARSNITANCIQLGYMDGGLTYTLPSKFIENTIESIPAHRLGTSEEIYKTLDFLINNSYINGTTIKLTGGL
jgi:NAD(P)-dependent dehydrogenase (short-subunit alcohol dehydrogenase family)